jgi:hypothetical protein
VAPIVEADLEENTEMTYFVSWPIFFTVIHVLTAGFERYLFKLF